MHKFVHVREILLLSFTIGNLNKFAFIQVRDHIHRTIRIHELFEHDSHLSALAKDGNGATSPDVYADSMDTIFSTGRWRGEVVCAKTSVFDAHTIYVNAIYLAISLRHHKS